MTTHAPTIAFAGIDYLDIDVQVQFANRLRSSLQTSLLWTMVMLCPISATAADLLPLKRGYFVDDSVPCANASNATLELFTGASFGANCVVKSVQKSGRSHRITQTCTMKDDEADWTFLYTVLNAKEFLLRNDEREFHFRYCEQKHLPNPWSTNDLSDLMDKSP
jgi:hypothetical protein